jgi:hypothetical protein
LILKQSSAFMLTLVPMLMLIVSPLVPCRWAWRWSKARQASQPLCQPPQQSPQQQQQQLGLAARSLWTPLMEQRWRLRMLLLVWQQLASHWTLHMQVRWV